MNDQKLKYVLPQGGSIKNVHLKPKHWIRETNKQEITKYLPSKYISIAGPYDGRQKKSLISDFKSSWSHKGKFWGACQNS